MIKNILKKEKGSITVFVLVAVIFFLAIAFTAYASSVNKSQSQDLEFAKIKSNYEDSYSDDEIQNLYLESNQTSSVVTPTEEQIANADSENVTFSTAYGTIEVIWLSGTTNTPASTPNVPVLTSNGESMTKVTWTYDEETSEWTEDETANTNWYSYNAISDRNDDGSTVDNLTSMWANAKTANGSYFVWIPRYAYRITYYESETSTDPTGYYDGYGMWKAEEGTVKYSLDSGIETVEYNGKKYIVHPAFCNGTENNYENGEWDTNLTGFWFAKYEMSGTDETDLTSVPNTASLRSTSIGNQYLYGRKATYGYTGEEETLESNGESYTYTSYMHSHLMKNSEWGAVAYLTHSQYGRNGNEIDINNSSSYITGNGGGSTSASSASGTTYAYNTKTGAKASTTGNIYGIYDMSGGAYDRVASYNKKCSSTYVEGSGYGLYMTQEAKDSSGEYTSTKYITAYSNGTSSYYGNAITYTVGKIGDATKEVNTGGAYSGTSTTSYYNWFSVNPYFVNSGNPFFVRGGSYNGGSHAGVFCSNTDLGYIYSSYGFRAALCP